MKKKFGQNLSQIGALYDFYGQKNLGRQSSGIELSLVGRLTKRSFLVYTQLHESCSAFQLLLPVLNGYSVFPVLF